MRYNMRNITLICSLLFLVISCNKINRDEKVDKSKLLGADYRLFQNTPAWELAKAVQDGDVDKIDEEIKKNPQIINYQEATHGNTLLNLSVYNDNYKGFKELLKLGANTNIADSMQCSTPLITACESFDDRIKYVKELIKYNVDINYVECNNGNNGQKTNRTALILASSRGNLDLVKLLIENGAKINYTNPNGEDALSLATLFKNYDIVLYLLQQGADCNKILYKKGGEVNPQDIYMKNWIEDEADHSAKEYSKIKEFLKKKRCL